MRASQPESHTTYRRNDYPQRRRMDRKGRIRLSPFRTYLLPLCRKPSRHPCTPGIWRHPHSFYPGNLQQQHYLVEDCWRDLPQDAYRYTSAFNNAYTPEQPSRLSDNTGRCITFRALCPGLSTHGQRLGLIGSCAALGSWEYCRPLRMKEVQPNVWHLTLDASSLEYPLSISSWPSMKKPEP